ncbi:MAG: PQQ-binding-like beta-propeller repeat protein [Phycisphaerales bacterium]|nr:PQQ-binding-like beta-propeller repeat protein [Phycisphaerales bacterium]
MGFRQTAVVVLLVLTAAGASSADGAPSSAEILTAAGVSRGLVVHVGCGDGKLTVAMGSAEGLLVHGLDTDAKKVRAARKLIASAGLYGKVSADVFDGENLPYIDNCVNLVVCQRLGSLSMKEIMRTLAPGGVAYVKTDRRWTRTLKPRPDELDDWTHYLHGPDNNAVSNDTIVAPPKRIQWLASPRWARSHEGAPSIQGAVSAAGRLFYVHDEGPIGMVDKRFPSKWSLVARDAFNGLQLWKRDIGSWSDPNVYWLQCKSTPNRRVVAASDRVYAAMGGGKAVTVFDAATGATLTTYKGTESVGELVLHKGVLLTAKPTARVIRRKGKPTPAKPTSRGGVSAVDVASGKTLWSLSGRISPLSLSARGDEAYFIDDKDVVCVGLKTGAERWRAASDTGSLVVHEKAILVLHGKGITAHLPKDGSVMWRDKRSIRGFVGPAELFVIDGLVWPAGLGVGLDLLTGKVKRKIQAGVSPGHHHRCHQRKATVNYILNSKRGVEFFDITGKNAPVLHDWVRGTCRMGLIPGNGLLYMPPHACFCYPGVMLKGFSALTPTGRTKTPDAKVSRLEKGPAFGSKLQDQASVAKSDWPTYRHDPARSGRASCPGPASLKPAWSVKLPGAGRLTPPVIAGGIVYVASVDTHQIMALKASDGSVVWKFTAGGRIDSPPTITGGLCVFGSRDGYVYCLRAGDGALAWRFLAAPTDRRFGAFGQVESVWPVHGSLLVRDGVVYAAAGRSSFVDGGITLYALDLATGQVRRKKQLYDKPMSVDNGGGSGSMDMLQGARTDIMVSGPKSIYMSRVQFDAKLTVSSSDSINRQGRRKTGLHLSATSGFLDDTYFNRSFWTYARVWPGYALATSASKSGQILVFDDETTYSVKVFQQRGPGNHFRSGFFTPGSGYMICADDNANESVQTASVKGAERERPDQMRSKPAKWTRRLPVRVRAMVLAGDTLLTAGPPDEIPADDPLAALQGRKGAILTSVSTKDGKTQGEYKLDHPPVFDGMAAAGKALFVVLKNRQIVCFK